MESLEQKLTKACENGTLLDVIHEEYYSDAQGEKKLPVILAQLHNKNKIDLLEVFIDLIPPSKNSHFFTQRLAFESALPFLIAPVSDVARCVKYLVVSAGHDLAANTILKPFRDFCEKEEDRPEQLLIAELKNIDEEFDNLSTALISGSSFDAEAYSGKAIDLIGHESELIQQRAAFALGRMNISSSELSISAVKTLKAKAKGLASDVFLATALRTIFSIVIKNPNIDSYLLEFLDDHCEFHGPLYIHASSEILFFDKDKVSEKVEKELLAICRNVNYENKGTIKNIDFALSKKIKLGDFESCVDFLEGMFSLSGYKISINDLNNFSRELVENNKEFLSALITRWFLSGNIKHEKYIHDLLADLEKGNGLGFDSSLFSEKNDGVISFLARKTCGWFFSKPDVAMNLIESLIECSSDETLLQIKNIIFYPLLISYPGRVKKYLENMNLSEKTKISMLSIEVLSEFEGYQKGLEAVNNIKELKPSEKERHAYRLHHGRVINSSMAEAREKSLFRSLFSGAESVLLYGNKSIHYIHHGEEKTRQEIKLQELSHFFEFPSTVNIDPHSVEKILWKYRVEEYLDETGN